MVRLEQITALVLAAGLAIPSYWFFWAMAGGGGYDRRGLEKPELIKEDHSREIEPALKDLPLP